MLLVRSYRTFAPLPVPAGHRRCFSVALSHGHPHWALPSKPGHQGARISQPILKEIGRNHLACFQIPSCLIPLGIIQKLGVVAQLDRATVS